MNIVSTVNLIVTSYKCTTIIRLEKSNLHAIFLLLPSVALLPAGRRRFGDRRAAVTVDEGAVRIWTMSLNSGRNHV